MLYVLRQGLGPLRGATHTHVHIQPYTYGRTHTDGHIQAYTYRRTRKGVHIQPYTYARTRTDVHIQTYTSRRTHTAVHIQAYAYRRTHTGVHIQSSPLRTQQIGNCFGLPTHPLQCFAFLSNFTFLANLHPPPLPGVHIQTYTYSENPMDTYLKKKLIFRR